MSKCLWCEKPIKNKTKVSQKYCKKSCCNAAYRSRSQREKNASRCELSTAAMIDLKSLRNISSMSADFIVQLCAVLGAEWGQKALDAFWEFAIQSGWVVTPAGLERWNKSEIPY